VLLLYLETKADEKQQLRGFGPRFERAMEGCAMQVWNILRYQGNALLCDFESAQPLTIAYQLQLLDTL